MLFILGTFFCAAKFILTMDQTNLCLPRVRLSSFTPIMSILPLYAQTVGKCNLLHTCIMYISCLLNLKCQWLPALTSVDKTSDISYERLAELENRGSLALTLALTVGFCCAPLSL